MSKRRSVDVDFDIIAYNDDSVVELFDAETLQELERSLIEILEMSAFNVISTTFHWYDKRLSIRVVQTNYAGNIGRLIEDYINREAPNNGEYSLHVNLR